MLRNMLISKIHRANVTFRDLNYMGSITIDKTLLEISGMKTSEKVEVYNISNGNRFSTYILEGEKDSGIIGINGAAARLVSIGDRIIIVNYGLMSEAEIASHEPKVILIEDKLNRKFRIKE